MVGSQIGEREVKLHLKVHLLLIYHIVIQSQLKYCIEDKVLSSPNSGTCQKTVGWVRFVFVMQ